MWYVEMALRNVEIRWGWYYHAYFIGSIIFFPYLCMKRRFEGGRCTFSSEFLYIYKKKRIRNARYCNMLAAVLFFSFLLKKAHLDWLVRGCACRRWATVLRYYSWCAVELALQGRPNLISRNEVQGSHNDLPFIFCFQGCILPFYSKMN